MTSASKISSAVPFRYATALMDLAEESNVLGKIEKNLSDLRAMVLKSVDLFNLINSPLFNETKRSLAIRSLADRAGFHVLTKNFIGVLSNNGRLNLLESIVDAFYIELSKRRGEITVKVQTAQDMSAKQQKVLQDSISKAVGSDVSLDTQVEPEILGGMIVTVGSQMIDDSVVRKLERLKAAMSKQSNENVITNIKEA
ncbi:MAG: F0F1 ATP synthase subunit delta [Alphaproteobacteria bacterium]|nr:F0F1 ATP synthase subunit delta [Alphaproteobacteria bacterium]